MDIRPVDLPELRVELLAHYNQPYTQEHWRQLADQGMFMWPGSGEFFLAQEMRRLRRELYWVSPDMVDLARAASQTMPEFGLDEPDLPSLFGFMLFGKPIGYTPADHPNGNLEQIPIVACAWGPISGADGTALWLSLYTETTASAELYIGARLVGMSRADARRAASVLPRLAYENETLVPFGEDWSAFFKQESILNGVGRAIRTAWALMQQPLARCIEVEPDRAARKRLRRAGQQSKPVRVIELRRPAHSGFGGGSREFHHQWIVRGHWRQQWYPARQVHRPVWIAPHIKGPEGAPLIGGEKVYAWKR